VPPKARPKPEGVIRRGAAEFDAADCRWILYSMENPNATTVLHELAHPLRLQLRGDDLFIIEDYLKVTDSVWKVKHEEAFADLFVEYIYKGEAPTPELEGIFAKLRHWLAKIFDALDTKTEVKMSREVQSVFNNLMAGDFGGPRFTRARKQWKLDKAGIETYIPKQHMANVPDELKDVADVVEGVAGHYPYYVDANGARHRFAHASWRGEISEKDARKYLEDTKRVLRQSNEEGVMAANAAETIHLDQPVTKMPDGADATFDASLEIAEVLARVEADATQTFKNMGRGAGAGDDLIPPGPYVDEFPEDWRKFFSDLESRHSDTHAVATKYAQRAADWSFLDYNDQRTVDILVKMIFPWGYWHTRSIPRWAQGLVRRPNLLAMYARTKRQIKDFNDNDPSVPDWAKDQIIIHPPGFDGSLYWDAEATLVPIHTVFESFDDPDREKTVYGTTLEAMGRYGPAVHPLLMMAYAAERALKGDEEGARSLGYIAPITRGFTSVTGIALEPHLWIIDPKTGLRKPGVGGTKWNLAKATRHLGWREGEGDISTREALLAATTRTGPVFEEQLHATLLAQRLPALGSILLGVRIRPRFTWEDEIAQASSDYRLLRDKVGSKEAAKRVTSEKPWISTVWMAYDNEANRVSSLAWNVLNRLPPGSSSRDLYAKAGLTSEMMDMFYESGGDISTWDPVDYEIFTVGVIDLAGILKVPDYETALEFRKARDARSKLFKQANAQFPGAQRDQTKYFSILRLEGCLLYTSPSPRD